MHSGGATLGWFQPIALDDLKITDRNGQTLLTVATVAGDTPLWRLVFDRSQLGVFRIEEPRVEVMVRQGGSNLRDVVEKIQQNAPQQEKQPARRPFGDANLGIDLVGGTVVVRREGSERSWDAKNVQFSARVEPARDGPGRELVVAPGRVLDHVAITPEVCEDFLKFVAPSLAKVTRAGGSFSLELDDCRVPLDRAARGTVVGCFTMHDLTASPGPLVESVATSFGIGDKNQLAHEQIIRFQLRDELVYHDGFSLTVGPMGIATQGTVSLVDQSLNIKLAVRLPEFSNKTAPLRGALAGETLSLPIRGTLGDPQIDPRVLRDSGIGVLSGVLDAVKSGRPITPEAIQQALRDGKLLDGSTPAEPNSSPQAGTGAAAEPGAGFPILESLLRERARVGDAKQADAAANPSPPATAPPPPSDRPLLRRARRLLDTLQPPPAPPAATPPAAGGSRSF